MTKKNPAHPPNVSAAADANDVNRTTSEPQPQDTGAPLSTSKKEAPPIPPPVELPEEGILSEVRRGLGGALPILPEVQIGLRGALQDNNLPPADEESKDEGVNKLMADASSVIPTSVNEGQSPENKRFVQKLERSFELVPRLSAQNWSISGAVETWEKLWDFQSKMYSQLHVVYADQLEIKRNKASKQLQPGLRFKAEALKKLRLRATAELKVSSDKIKAHFKANAEAKKQVDLQEQVDWMDLQHMAANQTAQQKSMTDALRKQSQTAPASGAISNASPQNIAANRTTKQLGKTSNPSDDVSMQSSMSSNQMMGNRRQHKGFGSEYSSYTAKSAVKNDISPSSGGSSHMSRGSGFRQDHSAALSGSSGEKRQKIGQQQPARNTSVSNKKVFSIHEVTITVMQCENMLEPDFPLRKLVVNPANEQLVHSGYLAALIREGAGGAPFQLASKKSMNDGNGMADGNPADKVETGQTCVTAVCLGSKMANMGVTHIMHAVAPNCSEGAGNKVSQDAAEPIMEGLMSRILARADSLNFEAITVPAIGMGSYKVDTARGTAKLCKAVGTWARDRSLFQPLSNIDFVVTSTELFDQFIKCMPDGSSEVNDFIAGNR